MVRRSLGSTATGFARLFGEGTVSGMNEGQLLSRFIASGDALAFEALVARHGPMVLSVCRKVLRDDHKAEDAFQATFLLLVRKARSIRGADVLGPWLHRVAYRVSVRASRGDAKRSVKEVSSPDAIAEAASSEPPDRDLELALHEALDSLPEKYRVPVVLCYLEGRTHDEAAKKLSWPIGSVKGRLSRARTILKTRLERRGVIVPAGLVLVAFSEQLQAAVPSLLRESTIEAAIRFAASKSTGVTAGSVSTTAAVLAEEAARTMMLKKLGAVAAGIVAVGLFVGSAAVLARQDGGKGRGPAAGAVDGANISAQAQPTAPKTDLEKLQGRWERISIVASDNNLAARAERTILQEIVITRDSMCGVANDRTLGAARSLKFEETATPRAVEWRRRGAAGEEVTKAIYRFVNPDTFTLCYDVKDPLNAPTEFSAAAGTGRVIMTYTRSIEGAELSQEQKAELAKLQGEWLCVGGESDGEALTAKDLDTRGLSTVRVRFKGQTKAWSAVPEYPNESRHDLIKIDVSESPHVMEQRRSREVIRTQPKNVALQLLERYAYKVDGDTLILSLNTNNPNAAPKELVTRPGDGRLLTIYRRAEPSGASPRSAQSSNAGAKSEISVEAKGAVKRKPAPDLTRVSKAEVDDEFGANASKPGEAGPDRGRNPSKPGDATSLASPGSNDSKHTESTTDNLATGAEIAARLTLEAERASDLNDSLSSEIADVEDDLAGIREAIRDLNTKLRERDHRLATFVPGDSKVPPEENRKHADAMLRRIQDLRGESSKRNRVLTELRKQFRIGERNIVDLRTRAAEAAKRPGKPNTMQVGDVVSVHILEALPGRPVSGERVVRPDGTISLGFYGDIKVEGLTRLQVKELVIEQMRKFITDESLGLYGEVEDENHRFKTVKVAPADSDRVSIDDSPTYARERTVPGKDVGERLNNLEQKIDAILLQLKKK